MWRWGTSDALLRCHAYRVSLINNHIQFGCRDIRICLLGRRFLVISGVSLGYGHTTKQSALVGVGQGPNVLIVVSAVNNSKQLIGSVASFFIRL